MVYVSTCCLKGNNTKFQEEVLFVVKKYISWGIRNMELGAAHKPFDDFPMLKKLKKQHELDFIFHGNFPSAGGSILLNLGSVDEKCRSLTIKSLLNSIEKLNYLEGSFFSLHPGFASDYDFIKNAKVNESNIEDATIRTIEGLQILVDRAKSYSIRIAIENMYGFNANPVVVSPEDFKQIKEKVDVGLLLDIGHLDSHLYHTKLNRKKTIQEFEPFIEEIHCHKGIKKDEHLLPEKSLFDDFKRSTLQKAKLTLEVNNADKDMILKGKKLLEEVKNIN